MYSLIRPKGLEKNPKLINVGPTSIPEARVHNMQQQFKLLTYVCFKEYAYKKARKQQFLLSHSKSQKKNPWQLYEEIWYYLQKLGFRSLFIVIVNLIHIINLIIKGSSWNNCQFT